MLVLLGLLSAIAIPRFVDLPDVVSKAVLQKQARNPNSSNTVDFAARKVDSPDCIEFGVTGFSPGVCQ